MKSLAAILTICVVVGGLTAADKPKYEAPKPPAQKHATKPTTPKPKYEAPKPPVKIQPSAQVSDKAQAAREARSQRKYEESQKAVAPPKREYQDGSGRTVAVRTVSQQTAVMRNRSSTEIIPEVRQKNITVHVTNHYTHPYDWYCSRPVVYVGGGYSSAFWWMMTEWSAERRARWLYNNRYNIEQSAYDQGVMDARVAAEVAKLEQRRSWRDPDYVDQEFAARPDLQYDQDYVEAVYNPEVVAQSPSGRPESARVVLWTVTVVCGGVVLCVAVYLLVFRVRWGC